MSKNKTTEENPCFLCQFLKIPVAIAFCIGLYMGRGVLADHPVIEVSDPSGEVTMSAELDFGLTAAVLDIINERFVLKNNIQPQEMSYGVTRGLVASLGDPYSEFLDPTQTTTFINEVNGELTGIGAELEKQGDQIMIVAPLAGTPAESVGLQPRDVIVAVDGEPTIGRGFFEVIDQIRGEEGTEVRLLIMREDWITPEEFRIKRAKISVPSVSYDWYPKDKVAVLHISRFDADTATEFRRIAAELIAMETSGIALDLRNNPGGYLDGALAVAGELVERERTVMRRKDLSSEEVEIADGSASLRGLPLVVLVNQGSASGSEILAGMIQDYGLGELVGQTTYGKGTVQELITLADGSTLRLTTARWYTPHGRSINEVGLTPDVEVSLSERDIIREYDRQLEEAMSLLREKKLTMQ